MIILSTLLLLISNAVSLRRDMSILYNRIAIIALLYAILQSLISFSIISNGGIGIHGGLFHVTNITQVFYGFYLFLLVLNFICIQLYRDICMLTPAGAPLIFGLLFFIKEKGIIFYKKNIAFFVVKNYCFIQLDKTKLSLVLYMFMYITTVFLIIFFYSGSTDACISFFNVSAVELAGFFLCIVIVFIGFLSKGINGMVDFLYNYIIILINIIIILGVILIYLYLIFDLNLNVVFYSLLNLRYFRYTIFILISLYMVFTLNLKGLFDILLIFSLTYLMYKFSSFLGLVLFINLINEFNLIYSTGSFSFGLVNKDIININVLDELLNKGAKALLENPLYFPATPEFNEYIQSITEIGNKSSISKLFFNVFKLLFNIINNKTVYTPSAFQPSSLPLHINVEVKLAIINESPILIQVLNSSSKLLGGASIGSGQSSLPLLTNELLFQSYSKDSIAHYIINEINDNVSREIREEFTKNYALSSRIINENHKYILDYLLSCWQKRNSELVCFNKINESTYRIFNYSDIYFNNIEKISVYHKIGGYFDDMSSMYDSANEYINTITSGLEQIDPNLHWLGGLVNVNGESKYSAYVFIKHDLIFKVDQLRQSCVNNIFVGHRSGATSYKFGNLHYDPFNSSHDNRAIAILDHYPEAEGKKQRYFKLPFNSPAKQNFDSYISLFDLKKTNLDKEIFFYDETIYD